MMRPTIIPCDASARPDTVNWQRTRFHVALPFLPHGTMQRTFGRWLLVFIVAQAAATVCAVVAIGYVPAVQRAVGHARLALLGDAVNPRFAGTFNVCLAVAAGTLAVTLILLPLVCLSIRRQMRGLHRLHAAIRDLGNGRPPKPLALGGDSEVDYLLASFNDMAARLIAQRQQLVDANTNLEHRVAERTEQLLHASEAKSRFLATMSHEIRTPLNGVIGTLTMMRDMPMGPKQQSMVRTGHLAAKSLLNLVNDVLDFSSIEAGQLTIADQPFILRNVIEEAITIVGPLANHKRLDITHRIEPDADGAYRGDPARLRQIVINLLNNAVKFTDVGHVDIDISADPDDAGRLCFVVRDTGIGMEPAVLGRLFQDYTRAGNDTTGKRGGTGLGLAICKQLVQLMGGRIAVASEVGSGSQFTFSIRAPRIDAPDGGRSPVEPRRVLLLGLPEPIAGMVAHILTPRGHHVQTCQHVAEADTDPLDWVIVDHDADELAVSDWASRLEPSPQVAWLAFPSEAYAQPRDTEHVCLLERPLLTTALLTLLEGKTIYTENSETSAFEALSGVPADVKLLVVDDQPINQFVVRNMLDMMGLKADFADSGEDAIEAVRKRHYQLVLMDYLMPGLDGIETTRRIRRMEAEGELKGRVPIVALTANAMQSNHTLFAHADMDDCLVKPIDPLQLRQLLAKMLGSSDATAESKAGEAAPGRPAPGGFEVERLRAICGQREDRFQTLLQMTDEHYRAFREQVQALTPQSDADEVRRLGHTIAGCAAQVQFTRLAKAAKTLESADAADRLVDAGRVIELIDECLETIGRYYADATSTPAASQTVSHQPNSTANRL